MIRRVKESDAKQICKIYNYYVEETNITFEESPISEETMSQRIKNITNEFPWFVYEDEGVILGYAYTSKWRGRIADRFTTESSIYVQNGSSRKGIGSSLYKKLIDEIKNMGFHAIIGCIALPNDRSEVLHKQLGFSKVGHFPEVGFKFGHWIDVVYWQLTL